MQDIPPLNLVVGFLPAILVVAIFFRWGLGGTSAIVALARMVIQLLVVGYLLVFIFDTSQPWIVLGVITFMMSVASWIALAPIADQRRQLLGYALASIAIGGLTTLALVTQCVLSLEPRWQPRVVIPLAGMIFANCMNCVSLAGERFVSETRDGKSYEDARAIAMRAAMIPITNALLSVGLVSLPGMMTGQILQGTSPLVAVRYQIMVMSMVFGAGGISAAGFLWCLRPKFSNTGVKHEND